MLHFIETSFMSRCKLFVCLLLIFYPFLSKAQNPEINLPMQFVSGYGPFLVDKDYINFAQPPADHPLYRSLASLKYNFIPSSLKLVEKGIIWTDFLQFLYQNVQAGYLSLDTYNQFRNERHISTTEKGLSKQPIACYILVIKGVDETGKEVLLIDTDNDQAFQDESPIVISDYETDNDFEKLVNKSFQIKYETVFKEKIVSRTIPLIILRNHDRYLYSFPQYGVASFKWKDRIYPIAVSHEFHFPNYQVSNIALSLDQKLPKDSIVRKGQYLRIDGQLFENKGVDFSSLSLILKEVNTSSKVYGAQKGMQAIPLKGKDAVTGKEIKLDDFKGKYLFIDFWGTWCLPCVDQLKKLSEIYSTINKEKVAFLGIAGKDNIQRLQKMISQKNIVWPNILSDNDNLIVEKYNIIAYPTGLLIDPDGHVVETDISAVTLEMILRKYLPN
jgi:peroxiredoxin